MRHKIIYRIVRNIQRLKRKVAVSTMRSTPVRVLFRNKKAISPVVSNLILVAAVIALGFAALVYARNISSNYQSEYHLSVDSDISQLKETLGFEYGFYNSSSSGCVQVYFMNAGTISVDVDKVYLSTSASNVTYTLKYMNGTQAPNKTLSVGVERQIVIPQILSAGTYTVRITTMRGSSFAYTFSV